MPSLYTVFDNVANMTIGTVIVCPTPEAAKRLFLEAIRSPDSFMAQHPDDYDLILLADIDDKGNVTTHPDWPITVVTGRDILDNLKRIAHTAETAR